MHAEDDTTAKRRRNLMATALAISVYILSHAKISSIPILVASAKEMDSAVIEVTAMLLFSYYLFRFWQVAPRPFINYSDKLTIDRRHSVSHKDLIVRIADNMIVEALSSKKQILGHVWENNNTDKPHHSAWGGDAACVVSYSLNGITATAMAVTVNNRKMGDLEVQLPYLRALIMDAKLTLSIFFRDNLFWEVFFPYMVAFFAMTEIALKVLHKEPSALTGLAGSLLLSVIVIIGRAIKVEWQK